MEHAFALLQKVLHDRGLDEAAASNLIMQRASEWIQRELSDVAEGLSPQILTDTVLFVEASNKTALLELTKHSEPLLQFLQGLPVSVRVTAISIVRQ